MELDEIKKTMIGGRTWRKETHTIACSQEQQVKSDY